MEKYGAACDNLLWAQVVSGELAHRLEESTTIEQTTMGFVAQRSAWATRPGPCDDSPPPHLQVSF
jgi:hypothetical protein